MMRIVQFQGRESHEEGFDICYGDGRSTCYIKPLPYNTKLYTVIMLGPPSRLCCITIIKDYYTAD